MLGTVEEKKGTNDERVPLRSYGDASKLSVTSYRRVCVLIFCVSPCAFLSPKSTCILRDSITEKYQQETHLRVLHLDKNKNVFGATAFDFYSLSLSRYARNTADSITHLEEFFDPGCLVPSHFFTILVFLSLSSFVPPPLFFSMFVHTLRAGIKKARSLDDITSGIRRCQNDGVAHPTRRTLL